MGIGLHEFKEGRNNFTGKINPRAKKSLHYGIQLINPNINYES